MGKTYLQGEILTALDLNNSLNELVNTTGYYVFTGGHEWGGLEVFNANVTVNSSFFTVRANTNINATSLSVYSNTVFYANANFQANSAFSGNVFLQRTLTLGTTAPLFSSNNINDKVGEIRAVVLTPTSGSVAGKTLVADDHGKMVVTTSTITVPASVFTAGQNVSIYNQTEGNISINAGAGLTLYKAGLGAGNGTLAKRGLATVIFITATEAVVSGAGLT